ncbi:hypothetical protein AKJ16_DCAP12604 [Drosera capensis]
MSAAAVDVDSVDIGGGGPVELSSDRPSVFETEDETAGSPVRVGASVVPFGASTFFLFRSIRRRAQRAKELKFRSSGLKKVLKDEALEKLKAIGNMSVQPGSSQSFVQTLLGGLTAGLLLTGYATLQLSFFGINSVGLFVYSAQLAFNSFTEGVTGKDAKGTDEKIQDDLNSSPETATSVEEISSSLSEQTSNTPEKMRDVRFGVIGFVVT